MQNPRKRIVNNKEYKILYLKTVMPCDYCPPNRGCNRQKKMDRTGKSWKFSRKTQWH